MLGRAVKTGYPIGRLVDVLWLVGLYGLGVALRLLPRLDLNPHLLTFEADIWYRLALAQYVLDHGSLPLWDLRYEAYGLVPTWYNPLPLHGLAGLARLFAVDLPTVSSRIMPFLEALTPLPFYLVAKSLYSRRAALVASGLLSLTPNFVFWSGITDPQSFTLFHIPIQIWFWIRFLSSRYVTGRPLLHLYLMGTVLTINFLTHLTYFLLVLILVSVHVGLVVEGRTSMRQLAWLCVPVVVSQGLTVRWWAPTNLYWWWTMGLTTSSGLYEGRLFLKHYGVAAGLLGHLALLALLGLIIAKRKRIPALWLLPIAWAVVPMIEAHNEGILNLFGQRALAWHTLIKPLEGFRFYCFLAQPLALCTGLVADWALGHGVRRLGRVICGLAAACALWAATGMLWRDLHHGYGLAGRFKNAGISLQEYEAAVWFRGHSQPTDRIATEYFTAQMFCGVAACKALEGSTFPLRNVTIPYITNGWQVQQDIYALYTSDDPETVTALMRRYGVTHIVLSPKILFHIERITQGDVVLEDIHGLEKKNFSKTLQNPSYFEPIYRNGEVQIFKVKSPPLNEDRAPTRPSVSPES